MQFNQISTTIALLFVSCVAQAQIGIDSEEVQGNRKVETNKQVTVINGDSPIIKRENVGGREQIAVISNSMHFVPASETIKNAPFSAEVINETMQKLADGNSISHKLSSMSFRDSRGRTRMETRNSKGEVIKIMIVDPVNGLISLDPKLKTATRVPERIEFAGGKQPAGGIREINIRTEAKAAGEMIEVKTAVGEDKNIVLKNVGRIEGHAGEGKFKTLTVDVNGPESGTAIGNMVSDGALLRLFSDSKWASKKQTKSLGNKEMEGVKVEGKLTSYEIPPGEIGNEQAIVVSDEVWIASDLQIVVYSKHSDPRAGDRIYRLTNLKREEVPNSQFVIPSDYKIRDISNEIKMLIDDQPKKIEKK